MSNQQELYSGVLHDNCRGLSLVEAGVLWPKWPFLTLDQFWPLPKKKIFDGPSWPRHAKWLN
jgi:hypothetical protein